jgi:hypothetical protein
MSSRIWNCTSGNVILPIRSVPDLFYPCIRDRFFPESKTQFVESLMDKYNDPGSGKNILVRNLERSFKGFEPLSA